MSRHNGRAVYAGVDIGGTFIKVGLVDRDGRVLARHEIASEAQGGWSHFVSRIGLAVDQCLSGGTTAGELAGIGLGYPGTVYPDSGTISGSPNIPGSQGSKLLEPLRERFSVPIHADNDVNAAATGEWLFGLGRELGARNLTMFALGTGVGGGVIIDGRVLTGAHHQGSELGHMILDPDGPLCGCGSFGCLEAFCGAEGIVRCAWRKLQDGRPSLLSDMVDEFAEPELTPLIISQAAEQGDAVALEVWQETGFYLGLGCVNLINVADPEVIAIGGQVAKAGAPLFDAIRRTVRARQRLNPWPVERILPARLGADAGIVGSAAVAINAEPA